MPSSVTTTSNVYEPGLCSSLGVQEKAPDAGSITAPAGAPSNKNTNPFAGTSTSVAVAMNDSCADALTVRLPIAPNTGATFTSLTVTVIVSRSSSAGEPSSVTTTWNE